MSTKELLKNARASAETVKKVSENAVSKAGKLKNDYTSIPGFSKYERNSAGVIRNKSNSRVVNIEAWSGKYKITNDAGKNVRISSKEIDELVPRLKTKTAVTTKKSEGKKENKKSIILALHNAGKDHKEIIEKTGYKPTTVYECINTYQIKTLYAKNFTAKQIAEKLGKKEESVKSFIERNCK